MGLSLPRQRALAGLLPALITLARFRNGFVFDDVFVIQRGDFIHQLANVPRAFRSHTMVASSLDAAVGKPGMDTYRPLTLLSFFTDAALGGRSPWPYHLTNLLLHSVVCVLLFEFLRRSLRTASQVPLLATLFFGLSPWLAEAHVWINGRSDLWLALFVLLALLARSPLATGAAMLGALWSKEIAVCVLPFVVLAPSERSVRERLARAWPTYAALAVYLGSRALALDGLRTHEGSTQLRTALSNLPLLLADGFVHIALPMPFALRNLRDDYAALPGWLAPTLAVLEVALLALIVRRPFARWAVGLAIATLAPAAMITTTLWPGFGRYLYLPSIAIVCALAELLSTLRMPERKLTLVAVTVLACSAALLVDATLSLHDEQTTYTRALARAPTQAWTIGFLGLSRKRDGHCDEAVPLLAVADGLAPDEPRYSVQLARCLVELHQPAQARDVAQRGQARFANTRAEPGFLVAELLTTPDPTRARALVDRCLALTPDRPDCLEAREHLLAPAGSRAPQVGR
ncbi:MAG TPA: hypothetical protein VFX59_01535 [Polyangiales bacterium]|nr:hypothetical protein [Polyangiales bacterium]